MSALHAVFVLSILVAIGHSTLCERLHLRPMRRRARAESGADEIWVRLTTLMFHFPSLLWIVLAVALLQLGPEQPGSAAILMLFGAVYALSGVGNLWATRRLHPGGVLLLAVSAIVFYAIATLPPAPVV